MSIKTSLKKYRQLPGSEPVYSGQEETQKDCMPLLLKTVMSHSVSLQADNTCERSKDVTRRGVFVENLKFSAASEVKHISTFSSYFIYFV